MITPGSRLSESAAGGCNTMAVSRAEGDGAGSIVGRPASGVDTRAMVSAGGSGGSWALPAASAVDGQRLAKNSSWGAMSAGARDTRAMPIPTHSHAARSFLVSKYARAAQNAAADRSGDVG